VPDDDLESRFTKLENEVDLLREEVASARALAALADRDVAEIRTEMRGYRQVLNALRETQLEQGQRITELRQELGEQGQRITELRQELGEQGQRITELRQELGEQGQQITELRQEMRAGFVMQADGMAQITALLTKIADQERGDS
jgi:chromosome segregation ATPase